MGDFRSRGDIDNRPPPRLYRYRSSGTTYFREELARALQRDIFFAPVTALNDPFEISPAYVRSSPKDVKELLEVMEREFGKDALPTGTLFPLPAGFHGRPTRRAIRKKLRPSHERAVQTTAIYERMLSGLHRKHGVACFSEVPDSLLMWAHYAASHTGIIVVYEWDEEEFYRGSELNPIRMRYSELRPLVSTVDLMRMGRRIGDGRIGDGGFERVALVGDVIESVYFTKSIEWSYEREWRIFTLGTTGYHRASAMAPVEVIIGARAGDQMLDLVNSTVAGRIRVSQMKLDSGTFRVVPTAS